jgi:hypothetical protein
MGISRLVGGVVLGLVALATEQPGAIFRWPFAAVLFAAWTYLSLRRRLARIVEDPAAPPTSEREPAARTRRRVALTEAAVLGLLALTAIALNAPALAGGISAGHGAALLIASGWLRRWEQDHHRCVLREPRGRWSAASPRGWGRGRGVTDPQDFYVAPGPTPADSGGARALPA